MKNVISAQVRNPFPGLRPFREEEEHLFFGREKQVHAMIDRLSTTRFLAVVGTSGSGKSSLVNCGLRPALRRGLMAKAGTAWRIAQFRPGGEPIRALARALSKYGVLFSDLEANGAVLSDIMEASLRMSKLGISRVYNDAHLPEESNLLIVVDQFEELFRYRPTKTTGEAPQRSEEATAFVNLLLDPRTHEELRIYVVLTMRSDFLGDCAEFGGLAEAINEGEYLIPRLTRDERRVAIARPIGVGGAEITPVLLTRLVNDVGDNPDQLSILQHALNRTWARWENEGLGQGSIDLQHYELIGTMAHALDQHAEKAYSGLPDERRRKICERIFKSLTDKGTDPRGIRRPTKFGVLCQLAEATAEEVTAVLSAFRKPSRSFVMPPLSDQEKLEPADVIDISHESLMRIWERLMGWTNEEAESAQNYRRLLQSVEMHATGDIGLLSDSETQFFLDWKEKERPTEAWAGLYGGNFAKAMAFLEESRAEHDRRKCEENERGERELRQAQDLAAERQLRFEEQSKATSQARRWLGAVAVLAVCLLFVGLKVGRESREIGAAKQKLQEQYDDLKAAKQGLAQRNDDLQKMEGALEHKNTLINAALREADIAKNQAEARALEAERANKTASLAKREMGWEAARGRKLDLESQSQLAGIVDTLLRNTGPQQAGYWQRVKAQTLLRQGNYEDASELLSKLLESFPDDPYSRTARGYSFFLASRPTDALADFQYIHENLDHASPLNNLNLTVTYASLGNYAAARVSLEEAAKAMHVRETEGGSEDLIPPDVTSATGRKTLEAIGATFESALDYMNVNLDAYVGDVDAFVRDLKKADDKARGLSELSRKDAYFVAMTWAWLHQRIRCPESGPDLPHTCKDYGALASEAAFWERAGYKEWAACYDERFHEKHARLQDIRYKDLSRLVEMERKQLGPLTCQNLKQEAPDVPALIVAAREAKAANDFRSAKDLLEQAYDRANPAEKISLLQERAEMLLAYGRDERKKAKNIDRNAPKDRLQQLLKEEDRERTESQKREEEHLRLEGKDASNAAGMIRPTVEAKYKSKIEAAKADQKKADEDYNKHTQEANTAFSELIADCDRELKQNPESSTARYYRALGQDWLDPDYDAAILGNVHEILDKDPENPDALSLLDELVPDSQTGESDYLQQNRQYLDRYYKTSPYSPSTILHQAKLAKIEKRYGEALQLIGIAIGVDPTNLSYYKLRAEIQQALGISEAQVKRNLADGYHEAALISKMRGRYWEGANNKEWETRADIAKETAIEEVRCDPSLTTCSVTKTEAVNGEVIYSGVLSILQSDEHSRVIEAKINRGSEDGIVVGSQGKVWSRYSKNEKGHERQIELLGTSEVLSVEPHSSLIQIQLDHPEGDGRARERDMVQLKARTPLISGRSSLWTVAKNDVILEDSYKNTLLDYDTLYSKESPQVDSDLLERMLQEVHAAGRRAEGRTETVKEGKFGGQPMNRVLENATPADFKTFIDYVAKYPGAVFGSRLDLSTLFTDWVEIGAPSE